jgi:hypothetical protein
MQRISSKTKKERGFEHLSSSDHKVHTNCKNILHSVPITLIVLKVPHTYSADGKLSYGDTVIIKHEAMNLSIASDPSIDSNPPFKQLLVVGSTEQRPTARNTFKIVRPPPSLADGDDEYDDTVKYGHPFLLVCNESLLVSDDGYCMNPPLYLSSTQRNYRTATRLTNKQSVYLTTQCDANSVWIPSLPSHGKAIDWGNKYLSDPVLSGEVFLLKHRNTNTCLTINSSESCQTDFGYESEVIASPETSSGKLSLVEYELSGLGTSRTLRKPDLSAHGVLFVTSSHPRYAVDRRNLPMTSPPAKDLLFDLSASIRSLGLLAFVEIRKECLEIDRGGRTSSHSVGGGGGARGHIDTLDFKTILQKQGLVSDSYYDEVFEVFTEPCGRSVEMNYRLLLERLRGKLSSTRSACLSALFERLSDGNTHLPVREVSDRLRAAQLPMVSRGGLTNEQFRMDYFERVVDTVRDGRTLCVTKEGFTNYWSDYSPLLESDEDFKLFLDICLGC